jgi:hypothetical protein
MPEPSRIGRMFTPILSTSPAAKSDCASSPILNVRLRVPAQPVDATPSSALTRRCLRGRTICLVVLDQDPASAAFRLAEPQQAILAFVFNTRRVLT